jgi:hypothetical protein
LNCQLANEYNRLKQASKIPGFRDNPANLRQSGLEDTDLILLTQTSKRWQNLKTSENLQPHTHCRIPYPLTCSSS